MLLPTLGLSEQSVIVFKRTMEEQDMLKRGAFYCSEDKSMCNLKVNRSQY